MVQGMMGSPMSLQRGGFRGGGFRGGYRTDPSIRHRLGRLAAARRRELRKLEPELAEVYSRRAARVAGAVFGLAAFTASMLLLVVERLLFNRLSPGPALALMAVWPLYLAAYAVVRGRAARRFRRRLLVWIQERSYPERDIARLQEQSVRQRAFELVSAQQLPSLALPVVLLSLALPLTLHLPFALVSMQPLEGFSGWMGMSAVIVGHAHVVLAVLSYRAVKAMCQRFDEHPNGWKVLMSTVLASVVPGGLVLLPPVITAVTGLLFVPLMFRWFKRVHVQEQALLA